jgi:DNA-binding Xre family transcriptional regulator
MDTELKTPVLFAKAVHMARWDRRWTLRKLQKECGISFSVISRIEKGAGCDFHTALVLAKALDLDLNNVCLEAPKIG